MGALHKLIWGPPCICAVRGDLYLLTSRSINKYLASGIKNVPEKFAVGRVGQESITGNNNFSNNSVVSAYFIRNLLRGMGTFK